jgi:hypothetical protein
MRSACGYDTVTGQQSWGRKPLRREIMIVQHYSRHFRFLSTTMRSVTMHHQAPWEGVGVSAHVLCKT